MLITKNNGTIPEQERCSNQWLVQKREVEAMDITRRDFPEIGQPGGPFCHSVRTGNLVFISGATAGGTAAANGTAAQQAEEVLKKLVYILEAEGATLANVVKVTVFLTNIADRADVAEVRRKYFQDGYPASTLVQVAALAAPNLKVEIEAVAAL
jgi:2-iminobutanoate/2-iminopropanoate deaminase